jgi:hypothetical protein
MLGNALTRCKAASAGEKEALDLYIACYKMEHFDKLNLKDTDFQEWKQHQTDHFKDPEFLGSLLLQVRFLTYALEAQDAKEKEMPAIIASLQAFINDEIRLVSNSVIHTTTGAVKENDKNKKPPTRGPGGGGARNFDSNQLIRSLRDSVTDCEYAKALQVTEYLVRQDWPYVPLEIGNIYELAILPYYLDKKPTELGTVWDARIKAQLAIKQATFTEVEYADYYKEHYPEMLWEKGRYLLAKNVDPVHALADMLSVIRNYPEHPKTGDWLKEIRSLVNQSQQPSGPLTEATPAAAAPSSAPPPAN